MRVGEPVYAVKFMVKVGEGEFARALSVLRNDAAPVLGRSGFRELAIVARRRELEKLDPEGPGLADSPALRGLIERARPHEAGRRQIIEKLESRPGGHRAGSYAHALKLHHTRRNRPEEFERLRRARIEQDRRLTEKVLDERNLVRVAGHQLDLYALYDGEADMKADTFDPDNRRTSVPYSGAFLAEQLRPLLFLGLAGIQHTVVDRLFLKNILKKHARGGLFASQVRVSVLPGRLEEAEARMRASLLPGLASPAGAVGVLALKSRMTGFSGGLGWDPGSLSEHGGGPPDPRAPRNLHPREVPVPYEVLTLWTSERDLLAGAEWQATKVPGELAGLLGGAGPPHGEHGELVLWT